jgi:N4-(beta-N-acetylglucosaminyl)-L-asparaginase
MWLRWKSNAVNASDAWLRLTTTTAKSVSRPGTINMNAVTAGGDIASVDHDQRHGVEDPRRVGDSPIIGAGQYCDNTVGAAGSTGRGEASIKVCGAFLAVEFMRQGMDPEAALVKVMERVIALTEPRLLGASGRPRLRPRTSTRWPRTAAPPARARTRAAPYAVADAAARAS